MEKILKTILDKITPTDAEHKKEMEFAEGLLEYLEKFKIKPILVGSLARETDLRGDKDIDIFLMFPEDTSREKLESEGLRIGKNVFKKFKGKYELDYAEHPYVKGKIKDYDVEIVPCYMGAEIKSSVDRTPLHNRYVKRKIKQNLHLSKDARLLKQFMKGVGVYGAESKTQGFSGYLSEVLTIHYGSFKGVLKASSEWRFGEVLDPENLWDDAASLKYFFTDASLIVVDPVDKDRNVAAAVSRQSLAEFIVKAKEFLKNPSEEFFFPKEGKPKSSVELKKKIGERGTKLAAFVFHHKKINENTLYSQLRKTEDAIKKTFTEHDFRVFKSGFWTNEEDKSVILLEFELWKLPPIKHHAGPPIDSDTENQENFVEKHIKYSPYIKDGRWVVDTRRKIRDIKELSPIILKKKQGFGKNLKDAKTALLYDQETLKIKEKKYLTFIDKFT